MRLHPILFELGARPHPPRDLYRAYLTQSDIFIGIYWESYGWIAPDMPISGIEDEFLLAEDMPRLIYVKEPAAEREEGGGPAGGEAALGLEPGGEVEDVERGAEEHARLKGKERFKIFGVLLDGKEPADEGAPVHAGGVQPAAGGPVVTPIHQTATFFTDAVPSGEVLYTRYGNNPNQLQLARKYALLEGTEDSIFVASGMGATALAHLAILAQTPADLSPNEVRLHPLWRNLIGDPRFDAILADANIDACCSQQICVEIPECDCLKADVRTRLDKIFRKPKPDAE